MLQESGSTYAQHHTIAMMHECQWNLLALLHLLTLQASVQKFMLLSLSRKEKVTWKVTQWDYLFGLKRLYQRWCCLDTVLIWVKMTSSFAAKIGPYFDCQICKCIWFLPMDQTCSKMAVPAGQSNKIERNQLISWPSKVSSNKNLGTLGGLKHVCINASVRICCPDCPGVGRLYILLDAGWNTCCCSEGAKQIFQRLSDQHHLRKIAHVDPYWCKLWIKLLYVTLSNPWCSQMVLVA